MKLAGKKKNYNHSLLLKVLFIYFLTFAVPIILPVRLPLRDLQTAGPEGGGSQCCPP